MHNCESKRLWALAAAALLSLSLGGCAVVSVASAAVSVTASAVELAADAAVGTVKIVGKGVGKAADALLDDEPAAIAAASAAAVTALPAPAASAATVAPISPAAAAASAAAAEPASAVLVGEPYRGSNYSTWESTALQPTEIAPLHMLPTEAAPLLP